MLFPLTRVPQWLLFMLVVGLALMIAVVIELVRGRTTREASNTAPAEEVSKKEQPRGVFLGSLSFAFTGAAFLTLLSSFARSYNATKDDSSWAGLLLFPALALGSAVVGLRQASRESRVTLGSVISGCAVVASLLLIGLLMLVLGPSR